LSFQWFDLIGTVGVLMIVVAYTLLQLDKLSSSAISFSLINALGAGLIVFSLLYNFNLSAFLMEGIWFFISLFGAFRRILTRTPAAQ
jgi:hypothetical protein